jgi:hypothetical protein
MPTRKFNENVLLAAIQGFEVQKTRIDQQIAELRVLLSNGSRPVATTPEAAAPKRKKFSAASRRKMALSQKARWAKLRGESQPAVAATPEPIKPKRRLSAAGRRNIQEALRKRWEQRRAEAAKRSAPAIKKAAVKAPSAKAAKRAPAKKKAAAKSALAPAPTAQAAG